MAAAVRRLISIRYTQKLLINIEKVRWAAEIRQIDTGIQGMRITAGMRGRGTEEANIARAEIETTTKGSTHRNLTSQPNITRMSH